MNVAFPEPIPATCTYPPYNLFTYLTLILLYNYFKLLLFIYLFIICCPARACKLQKKGSLFVSSWTPSPFVGLGTE